MINVEILDSLAAVDRAQWDAVAGDDVFASWGWLRTFEETHVRRWPHAYFVARDGERVVGVAPCRWIVERPGAPAARELDLVLYGRAADAARRAGVGTTPALTCGTWVGVGGAVLVAAGERGGAVTERLLDAMEQAAGAAGATLCFRNVVGESPLAAALRGRRYARGAELPTTVLDVRWSTFRDYLRDLKRTHASTARNIPHELNRSARAGVTFSKVDEPGDLAPRLHGLLDAHNRRLNGTAFPYDPAFLPALRARLEARVTLYLASREDRVLSIVVGLRSGDEMFLVMVGYDESAGRDGYVYFNNSYNVPIRDAIESGVRRVWCGKLVYDVKVRRGFRPFALDLYLRAPGRLGPALRVLTRAQSALMRARYARIIEHGSVRAK